MEGVSRRHYSDFAQRSGCIAQNIQNVKINLVQDTHYQKLHQPLSVTLNTDLNYYYAQNTLRLHCAVCERL